VKLTIFRGRWAPLTNNYYRVLYAVKVGFDLTTGVWLQVLASQFPFQLDKHFLHSAQTLNFWYRRASHDSNGAPFSASMFGLFPLLQN
jgi:hypothetical protein